MLHPCPIPSLFLLRKLQKSLRPPRRKKKSTAESAEIAEIVPGKPLGRFDPPGRVRKSAAFPPASWP